MSRFFVWARGSVGARERGRAGAWARGSVGARERGRAGAWARGSVGARERGRAGAWARGSVGARERGRAGAWARGSVGARERGRALSRSNGQFIAVTLPARAPAPPKVASMLTLQLQQQLYSARILIVDDEPANVRLLERVLESAGYTDIVSTTDARQVKTLIEEKRPALLLLDLMMPHLDGFAVLAGLQTVLRPDELLPTIVLTADASLEARHRALDAGAFDFVLKPLDALEVLLRVRNLLAISQLYQRERQNAGEMELQVAERTRQLADSNALLERANAELASANAHLSWAKNEIERAQDEIVGRLAEAVEVRDDTPSPHLHRVGALAQLLARKMKLHARQIELIRHAAPLHDIGKIGISEAVLLKPAPLTAGEWQEAKTHVEIGASMLGESDSPLMQMAQSIALTHHERWDGQGYPRGLKGVETPVEGRIIAVVDVFDALTTERPYKRAWTTEEALTEIREQAGRQFDPEVVAAFAELMQSEDAAQTLKLEAVS